MNVRVTRSPLRLIAYAVLAVPAILLAVDMTISYRFIDHPETRDVVVGQTTDESGEQVDVTESVLTDAGRAQRRRDLLFGAVLFLGGAATLGWALRQLIRPTEFLRADDDDLMVRVDGLRRPARRLAWSDIAEIRSGVIEDDGVETAVLSLRLRDEELIPQTPSGAVAEPPWLHLLSDEWDTPAFQVAAQLDHMVVAEEEGA